MAITITAKLDASGVKVGASQAAAALGGLENATEGLAATAETTGDSLTSVADEFKNKLAELAVRTGSLQAAIAEMGGDGASSLGRVEAAAESAGEAMRGAGSSIAAGVTATGVAFSATMQFVDKLKQGLDAAVRGVNALAADGNAGAIELQKTFGEVHERLLKAFNDPAIQEALVGIARIIEETILPAIDMIPDAFWKATKAATEMYLQFQTLTAQMTDAQANGIRQMLSVADMGMDLARKAEAANREARKQREKEAVVLRELAEMEQNRAEKALAAKINEVDSAELLIKKIEEESEAIVRLAREGKLSDDERKQRFAAIRAGEDRIADLRKEQADAARRQSDDATSSEKAASEERLKIAQSEADMRERLAQEEVARQQKALQQKLDDERRAIEERKRLLTGKDVDGANQILGAQDPEQVRQAVINRRGFEAANKARQELDPKFSDDAAGQNRLEAAVAKERQKAVAMAKRQFDRGQFDPEEVRQAQAALANASADQAAAQGTVSKETAQAVKESIAEMARTANELEQVQGEITNMRKLQEAIILQGQRRRGQVAGAGR